MWLKHSSEKYPPGDQGTKKPGVRFIPVTVECYSGYKADEYPKAFTLDNKRYEVKEVIDRWYQGDLNPEFPVTNYFKVETACGNRFILKHDLESDMWYVCEK